MEFVKIAQAICFCLTFKNSSVCHVQMALISAKKITLACLKTIAQDAQAISTKIWMGCVYVVKKNRFGMGKIVSSALFPNTSIGLV